jgi:hypothetical protein
VRINGKPADHTDFYLPLGQLQSVTIARRREGKSEDVSVMPAELLPF